MSSKQAEKGPTRLVRCPRCRKSVRYDQENPFRPFCSALCKNEDIISWAEQGYRIPSTPVTNESELSEAQKSKDEDDNT